MHSHLAGWLLAGTNDTHRLLPQQVKQHLEVEDGLRGTNGKMLAVLLDNPRYDTLEAGKVRQYIKQHSLDE